MTEVELSRLAVLPARPPTPPKESGGHPSSQDSDPLQISHKDPHPGLHTPTDSPASEEPNSKSPGRRSKRVGFRLGSSKLNNASSSSPHGPSSAKSCPNSRDMKPAKSILKPSKQPVIDSSIEQGQTRDFPRMLEDYCQQLAGPDMSPRLDAYITLNNNLKTYKNGPEQRALAEKLPLLTSFIERDLQEADSTSSARGTQLATEVVKLVSTLLWSPTMADELPEAFQLFVLNKAISVAGSDKVPKALISQFLHLLAIQKFRPKILSSDRINRLLSFLKHIEERVKGKQIIAHRLDIYKRLINQAPSIMSIRFRDWYEHIFHALMSTTKEIRSRALSLGFEAGQAFGASEQVTKCVSALFSRRIEAEGSEQSYGHLFAARLAEWLASKEETRHVPQVWSCVLMFLRHHPRPLERWSCILDWLQLMKKCFNSTDNETRLQANRAWARLIFAIDPCPTTGDSMVALLREPIRSQLDRAKGTDKDTSRIKASVISVYSTLLYYAIRPGATHDTLDRYWKACVTPFFSTPREHVTALEVPTAADILCSLLGDRISKSWNTKRAMESLPIKPEEIPRLDSKWLRQRVSWVMPLVEAVLLDEAWWQSSSEQPPSVRVWKCFVGALAEAGRKEIKVSPEAKVGVAEILGTLERVLVHSKSALAHERFAKLLEMASSALGPLPFTEPRFVCASKEQYQVADLSANQARKIPAGSAPASTLLLRLLVRSAAEASGLEEAMQKVLEMALRPASSRRTRSTILREVCSKGILYDNDSQDTATKLLLWRVVMTFLVADIEFKSDEGLTEPSQLMGHDFHDAIKIFEYGFELAPDSGAIWERVKDIMVCQLSEGDGQAAASANVIEPLAKFLSARIQKSLDQDTALVAMALLERVQWPRQRPGVDLSSRRISSLASPNARSASPDPYKHLYTMVGDLLSPLLRHTPLLSRKTCSEMLAAVLGFVSRIPVAALALSLNKLQPALASWVTDNEGKLNVETSESMETFKQAVDLWNSITQRIQELPSFDAATLSLLKELLICGLTSRHRSIANSTIELWNRTFGTQEQLKYSEDLQRILVSISQSTEMLVPGIDVEVQMNSSLPPVEYLNTPADLNEKSGEQQHHDAGWLSRERAQKPADREPLSDLNQNEQSFSTPVKRKGAPRAEPTPRLRHDCSQIEFAEITSSPPNLERIESQLLTERQREVRDRQHAAASAMFPDLRSSPAVKSLERKQELPRLQLRAEQDLDQSDIDDAQSPTLPSPSGTPYLGSSPTPSQRRQSSKDRHSAAPDNKPEANSEENQDNSDEQTSDGSAYYHAFGQTYGEELLALYEQPLSDDNLFVDIVVPSEIASDRNQIYVDAPIDSNYMATSGTADDDVGQEETQEEPSPQKPLFRSPSKATAPPQVDVEMDGVAATPTEDQAGAEKRLVDQQIFDDVANAAAEPSTDQPEQDSQSQIASQDSQDRGSKRKRSKSQGEARPSKSRKGRRRKNKQPRVEARTSDDDMEDCIIVAVNPTKQPIEQSCSQPSSSPIEESASFPASQGRASLESGTKKRRHEGSMEEQATPAKTPSPNKARKLERSKLNAASAILTPPISSEADFREVLERVQEKTAPATGVAATQTTPSRSAMRGITGEEFLVRVQELLGDAKTVELGGRGDDILASLIDVSREIIAAKQRD